jgi:SAM-dependent methyltransferase
VTAALTRVAGLLRPSLEESELDTSKGYLDLLGERPPGRRTLALAVMRSRVLPIIYERWWRPVLRVINRLDPGEEQRFAGRLLDVHSGQLVLDVACGPGNFTRPLASAAGAEGLVVGVDESATMLGKAVDETTAPQVAYVRGDARELPFADGAFDAVGCFLALHLVPEPFRALGELIRVLGPGGRIAVSAPCRPPGRLPKVVDRVVNAPVGMRMFGRDELTGVFERAGLERITQKVTGLYQIVGAVRPG